MLTGLLLSLLRAALAPFAWDAVVAGGRLWTSDSAPWVAAMRCPGGGFVLALGYRWELTVSPA